MADPNFRIFRNFRSRFFVGRTGASHRMAARSGGLRSFRSFRKRYANGVHPLGETAKPRTDG
jgi:hypothetical protein